MTRPLIDYPDEEIAEVLTLTKANLTPRVALPGNSNVFHVDPTSHLVVMQVSVVESTCDVAIALLTRAKKAESDRVANVEQNRESERQLHQAIAKQRARAEQAEARLKIRENAPVLLQKMAERDAAADRRMVERLTQLEGDLADALGRAEKAEDNLRKLGVEP